MQEDQEITEYKEWVSLLERDPKTARQMWVNELNPDLVPYVRVWTSERITLAHPLCLVEDPLTMPAPRINRGYAALSKQAKEKREARDWSSYIWTHERPFRLYALLSIEPELSDVQYWQLLSEVWRYSENIYENLRQWVTALSSSRPERQEFMSTEDRACFEALPPTVTIYRGYRPNINHKGLSWSLSKEVAQRLSKNVVPPGTDLKLSREGGKVRQKTISKTKALAYLNGRGEQEVIWLGDYPGLIVYRALIESRKAKGDVSVKPRKQGSSRVSLPEK
jgi:hypothetical protein